MIGRAMPAVLFEVRGSVWPNLACFTSYLVIMLPMSVYLVWHGTAERRLWWRMTAGI